MVQCCHLLGTANCYKTKENLVNFLISKCHSKTKVQG